MKHLRHLALSVLLVLSMMTSALAAEVPVSLVAENLNGQQRIVKTYELPPGTDPGTLKELPFDYDGFTYTWAYTTKEEHTFLETKTVTETVTVETEKRISISFWSSWLLRSLMTMGNFPVSWLWTTPPSPPKRRAIPPRKGKLPLPRQ